jgi:hypothetical protein
VDAAAATAHGTPTTPTTRTTTRPARSRVDARAAVVRGAGRDAGRLRDRARQLLGCGADLHEPIVSLLELDAGRRLQVDAALQLDQLSMLMTLIITGVGFLIHLFSSAT